MSTLASSGVRPVLAGRGPVLLYLGQTGQSGPAAVHIVLNRQVIWRLMFAGGTSLTTVDLGQGAGSAAWISRPGAAFPVKVDKLSISFEPELGDAVRSAAAQAGKPVSAWLAEAAAGKLRAGALAEFLTGWEAGHGVLTAGESARAERELGVAAGDSAA